MEDEAAPRIDEYKLVIPDKAIFGMTTWRDNRYTILYYKSKEDLKCLLSLSSSDRVILTSRLASGEVIEDEELTLEEACSRFGSEVMSQTTRYTCDDEECEGPKYIDILGIKLERKASFSLA